MLEISRALARFRQETGRNILAMAAVSDCLAALKILPADVGLVEAVRAYVNTLGTLKPRLLADAVPEFIAVRRRAPTGKPVTTQPTS
jgi:hypothetical protein